MPNFISMICKYRKLTLLHTHRSIANLFRAQLTDKVIYYLLVLECTTPFWCSPEQMPILKTLCIFFFLKEFACLVSLSQAKHVWRFSAFQVFIWGLKWCHVALNMNLLKLLFCSFSMELLGWGDSWLSSSSRVNGLIQAWKLQAHTCRCGHEG